MATRDLAGRAESLVQALHGVDSARIHASDSGIDAIHVTARDADVARHMAAHVRSALLAGLATPVLPGRIHVRVAAETGPERRNGSSATAAPPAHEPGPHHRIRILDSSADEDRETLDRHADRRDTEARDAPARAHTRPEPSSRAEPDTGDEASDEEAAAELAPAHERESVTARPRLVAVDSDRPGDGRVVCRVAIAFQTRVHRAEAVAVDLPGAAAQAAAQAAVRALLDAGIAGLELNGLREVEIAGREYVLVALRQYDIYTRTRSGSAPIIGTPERSAAEATVAAANALI